MTKDRSATGRVGCGPGLGSVVAAATVGMLAAGSAAAQDRAALLEPLPDDIQALYTSPIEVGESAYDAYAPRQKPWRWCHSESYMGNAWRVTMNDELERLVGTAIEAGDVAAFLVADSNGDTTRQISQIRSFIDRDCDIITTIAGSSTGLDDAIADAFEAGIAVVTTAGAVTSPYAVNVLHNQHLWGYEMGVAIARNLTEGGNVLQVEGIPGHPLVVQENAGFQQALEAHPELNRVRKITGRWTASHTKSAVLQALATMPQPIDAVWTTGSETRVIAEAFEQVGRPVPLTTGSITGDALGYWHENPETFRFEGGEVSPHVAAHNAFRIGMRLLHGQKPRLDTIIAPMPMIAQDDLADWYEPCMQPDSASIFPIPPENPFPDALMDGYFTGGTGTPHFDYATVPPVCP